MNISKQPPSKTSNKGCKIVLTSASILLWMPIHLWVTASNECSFFLIHLVKAFHDNWSGNPLYGKKPNYTSSHGIVDAENLFCILHITVTFLTCVIDAWCMMLSGNCISFSIVLYWCAFVLRKSILPTSSHFCFLSFTATGVFTCGKAIPFDKIKRNMTRSIKSNSAFYSTNYVSFDYIYICQIAAF